MNNVVKVPKPDELSDFIQFLFEGLEDQGYMYVVAKEPENKDSWDQVFFEYPAQVPNALQAINTYSKTHDIYIAPVLYNSHDAKKEHVKVTQVVWCDMDGNAPTAYDIPPSLVIRSSEPGHEHVYWKLDTPLYDVQKIEDCNRRLCFKYGADLSGWDATQVLRPPYTINHKRQGAPVTIIEQTPNLALNLSVFEALAAAPEKTVDYSLWEKIDLPTLEDVIYRNKFGPDFRMVFEKQKSEVMDRSASLTQMAFICAEAGLNDPEIYVIISHLADRWEKFSHHTASNRAKQLISIIEHARIKYPHSNFDASSTVFAYTPKTLFNADIQVDWAIEGLLMKKGSMLLAGPGGIGKSQISMQFMFHCAVGRDFLHYKIPKPARVGMFSLEMGDVEVKSLINTMYPRLVETFTPEELELLEQNCTILPFGEALPLNTTAGQHVIAAYQEEYKWEGIFIDSVGSAVLGNVNSSEVIQGLTNFNDRFRNRNDCFLWYVHHMRKAQPGSTNYGSGDDVYGDVYLSNRATSVYTMTRNKSGLIRVRNTKNRHAETEDPYLIRRELGLTFSHQGVENAVPDPLESIVKKATQDTSPSVDLSPKPFIE